MNKKAPTSLASTPVLKQVQLQGEPKTLVGRSPATAPGRVTVTGQAPSTRLSMPSLMSSSVGALPVADTAAVRSTPEQAYAQGRQAGLKEGAAQLLASDRQAGFDQGYEAGLAQAQKELKDSLAQAQEKLSQSAAQAEERRQREFKSTLDRLEKMLRAVPDQLAGQMASMEDDMVELCFTVICQILGERLVTPQGVRAYVAQATQDWPTDADLKIHLHPDDLDMLRHAAADEFIDSSRATMLEGFSAELEQRVRPPVQWLSDPGVGLGGCLLRSTRGGLDARLSIQLNQLMELLLSVREQRRQANKHVDLGSPLSLSMQAQSSDDPSRSEPKGPWDT